MGYPQDNSMATDPRPPQRQYARTPFIINQELACLLDDMSLEDLRPFALAHIDNESDHRQMELHVYACFLLYERTNVIGWIETAVSAADVWAAEVSVDDPSHKRISDILSMLNKELAEAQDIIDMRSSILQEPSAPDYERFSENAWQLRRQYDETGSIDSLRKCITAAKLALSAITKADAEPVAMLGLLTTSLNILFEETGSMESLNEVIMWLRKFENVYAKENTEPPLDASINLANSLARRSERNGSLDDLNQAIEIFEKALKLDLEGPERARLAHYFGYWLSSRFDRTKDRGDLDRAIHWVEEALNNTMTSTLEEAEIQGNLANLLLSRLALQDMSQIRDWSQLQDIDRAVEITRRALDSKFPNATRKATQQCFHAKTLLKRSGFRIKFLKTNRLPRSVLEDVSKAIEVAGSAVKETPLQHPMRVKWLTILAQSHFARSLVIDFSVDPTSDEDKSLEYYEQGWACRKNGSRPSDCILCARYAASILGKRSRWEDAWKLLQDAVRFLPTVSPRTINHTDKQHMLAQFQGLSSMTAAVAISAGKQPWEGLQLLEAGRGVISSLLMDIRGDLADVRQQCPDLIAEFESLRNDIDSPADLSMYRPGSNALSWEQGFEQRLHADEEFTHLLRKIRAQPGCGDFLLAPTKEKLIEAADPDPLIVVNVSEFRSDAYLIEKHGITVVDLPDLNEHDVKRYLHHFRSSTNTTELLRWLWNKIARPCLEGLGLKGPVTDNNDWPRVWWIPTGLLSQLPLHAAGLDEPESRQTVLDWVMSSYATSVKSLIHGRRTVKNSLCSSSDALLVGMPSTPGLPRNGFLPYAVDEITVLESLCSSLGLNPITTISHKPGVLAHLKQCRIFHFAGHGQSHRADPSQSLLLLEDYETDPLTVGDLRDHKLQENPPFLAYLSACSTGTNEVDNLADEGIHLVSAFQLAGFRHVVGTLLPVSDRYCVDVARIFYETIRDEGLTDLSVCRGLHRAVRALRAGEIGEGQENRTAHHMAKDIPSGNAMTFDWIPYIHFGV